MTVRLRPLEPTDAPAAVALRNAAFRDADERAGRDWTAPGEEREALAVRTLERSADVDRATSFVADVDGRLVGFAVSIVRERFWGLAGLFVHPDQQNRGIGRRLLHAVTGAAGEAALAMVVSSEDPRAIRRYATAGFGLHPAVQVRGHVDRTAIQDHPGVRDAGTGDLDLVDDVDRRLRGASRRPDVAFSLELGAGLVVVEGDEGRGFAVHRGGSPVMLGADTPVLARRLLWAVLAEAGPDEEVTAYCWTAAQRWAIDIAVQARLAISPAGPLCIRGAHEPPGPWLPSGIYF